MPRRNNNTARWDAPPANGGGKGRRRSGVIRNNRDSIIKEERILARSESIKALLARSSRYPAEQIIELVSSLQEVNAQNQDIVKHLQSDLKETEDERDAALQRNEMLASQAESLKAEVVSKNEQLASMERTYGEIINKIASKALSVSQNRQGRHEHLARHNQSLAERVQGLSTEREMMAALQKSMEEAVLAADAMSREMSNVAAQHDASARIYEEKLSSLEEELRLSEKKREELNEVVYALREDNRFLGMEFAEAQEFYERQLIELTSENEALRFEKEEAYRINEGFSSTKKGTKNDGRGDDRKGDDKSATEDSGDGNEEKEEEENSEVEAARTAAWEAIKASWDEEKQEKFKENGVLLLSALSAKVNISGSSEDH